MLSLLAPLLVPALCCPSALNDSETLSRPRNSRGFSFFGRFISERGEVSAVLNESLRIALAWCQFWTSGPQNSEMARSNRRPCPPDAGESFRDEPAISLAGGVACMR